MNRGFHISGSVEHAGGKCVLAVVVPAGAEGDILQVRAANGKEAFVAFLYGGEVKAGQIQRRELAAALKHAGHQLGCGGVDQFQTVDGGHVLAALKHMVAVAVGICAVREDDPQLIQGISVNIEEIGVVRALGQRAELGDDIRLTEVFRRNGGEIDALNLVVVNADLLDAAEYANLLVAARQRRLAAGTRDTVVCGPVIDRHLFRAVCVDLGLAEGGQIEHILGEGLAVVPALTEGDFRELGAAGGKAGQTLRRDGRKVKPGQIQRFQRGAAGEHIPHGGGFGGVQQGKSGDGFQAAAALEEIAAVHRHIRAVNEHNPELIQPVVVIVEEIGVVRTGAQRVKLGDDLHLTEILRRNGGEGDVLDLAVVDADRADAAEYSALLRTLRQGRLGCRLRCERKDRNHHAQHQQQR